MLVFDYPFPPREVVQLFRDYFGPTRITFSKLDVGTQATYAADLETLWRDHNEAGSERTVVNAEYLEIKPVRA